jgi:hypothetical protein
MRIAMWSGPRNLSTAMMYSFGNREDFATWDEPFYAPYLAETRLDHPMAEEIIATHEADPEQVARQCLDTIPDDKPHFYMKHMPHHMRAGFPTYWAQGCVNIHLLRHPARVIASYGVKRGGATLADIGYEQQLSLFNDIGGIVLDSAEVRANPERTLRKLCEAIDLEFDEKMLEWPSGQRKSDGVWAAHWYNAVHKSTRFAGAEGEMPSLSCDQDHLLKQALPAYEALVAHKI